MMPTRNNMSLLFLILATVVIFSASAFQLSSQVGTLNTATTTTTLSMAAKDEDFLKWDKARRNADANDNVVEMLRPLGLILDQYPNGDVYVKTVAPKGNAARTGQVKEGDIVTMCSATFGDQMWSTRGVGLTRVMAAIRVRAGPTVSLVLESPNDGKKKKAMTEAQIKAKQDAARAAQAKKDQLLNELEDTEQKLKPKKFFGLF